RLNLHSLDLYLLLVSFCYFFFFFFQAEDGIRDDLVTGVQTCALPISRRFGLRASVERPSLHPARQPNRRGPFRNKAGAVSRDARSEERRVGKECRSRGSR